MYFEHKMFIELRGHWTYWNFRSLRLIVNFLRIPYPLDKSAQLWLNCTERCAPDPFPALLQFDTFSFTHPFRPHSTPRRPTSTPIAFRRVSEYLVSDIFLFVLVFSCRGKWRGWEQNGRRRLRGRFSPFPVLSRTCCHENPLITSSHFRIKHRKLVCTNFSLMFLGRWGSEW